jgi:hypothetical protein
MLFLLLGGADALQLVRFIEEEEASLGGSCNAGAASGLRLAFSSTLGFPGSTSHLNGTAELTPFIGFVDETEHDFSNLAATGGARFASVSLSLHRSLCVFSVLFSEPP